MPVTDTTTLPPLTEAMRHTPAPWRAIGAVQLVGDANSPNGQHNLWCGEIHADAPDYRGEVCMIQSADQIGGISREEAAANARLIAAAPDMLAALRLCLREIGDSERFTAQEAIAAAKAAIARAEAR